MREASEFERSAAMDELVARFRTGRAAVLTGAGCSTESGIPDYRGPGTRARARNPIQYREFLRDPAARQRYWARSALGWPRVAGARPNPAHAAIAALQAAGRLSGVVTQNVDRLHQAAGARGVVELHGSLHEVVCLGCGRISPRAALQEALRDHNPGWPAWPEAAGPGPASAPVPAPAPDGDVELELVDGFRVVACPACGGVLKPHVVFFGESVPLPRVDAAWRAVHDAELLLVVGSSLTVFSGYRFVKGAAKAGTPVAILNLGETRGDPHASLRIDGRAGELLPELARALGVEGA